MSNHAYPRIHGLDDCIELLGNEKRRRILIVLAALGYTPVHKLCDILHDSPSATSQNCHTLRNWGLVDYERRKREHHFFIRSEALEITRTGKRVWFETTSEYERFGIQINWLEDAAGMELLRAFIRLLPERQTDSIEPLAISTFVNGVTHHVPAKKEKQPSRSRARA